MTIVREQEVGGNILRRLRFFVDEHDLPEIVAPLIARTLWRAGNVGNIVFAYPGVPEKRAGLAGKLLLNGAEAILLRSDRDDPVVLSIARNRRNEHLVEHWADCVDRFSLNPYEDLPFDQSLGGNLVNYLCDEVGSIRISPGYRHLRKKTPSSGAATPIVRTAIRKLMPLSEELADDPSGNAIKVLNATAPDIDHDAHNLITNLMVSVWTDRRDLQEAYDLQSPEGRRGFADWFLTRAPIEFDLDPQYLEPIELARSIPIVPNEAEPISKLPPRADRPSKSGSTGINLIGYPRAEMGMGEQLRSCAGALETTQTDFCLIDFQFGIIASQADRTYDHLLRRDNPFPINLFHINADQMQLAVEKLSRDFFRNRYNIGYWEWELSKFPEKWKPSIDLVDEIWAPSKFIQKSVSQATNKPVIWMPLAIEFPDPLKAISKAEVRSKFKLPADSYLFLFSFDFSSFSTRKNFRACIDAFHKAFPKTEENVGLVFKTIRHERHKREFWDILREVGDDSRIHLIDRVLRQHEMRQLTASCDSFLSLHRSEGFGLGIAEAMFLGKPVVATNYSGNTDFTHHDNCCLVDYQLIPVEEGHYVFPEGQVWADPDVTSGRNLYEAAC